MTFEVALALAQRKELTLTNIVQSPATLESRVPATSKLAEASIQRVESKEEPGGKGSNLSQFVAEMRDLRLFLLQGQTNNRIKSSQTKLRNSTS